jgi:hypothetical protein
MKTKSPTKVLGDMLERAIDAVKTHSAVSTMTNPNVELWKPMLQLVRAVEEKDAPSAREAQRALKDNPEARDQAIALVKHLKTAEPTDFGRLYRGVEAGEEYAKNIKNMKVGDTFDLPVSSFSKDEGTAKLHATKWSEGKEPFIFVLDGPAKGVDTKGISLVESEMEVLIRDKFRVTKIDGNRIHIERVQ